MRIFKAAILGCGMISRTYAADIKAFYPQLRITACADVDPARAKSLAEEYGIPRACGPEELLADPEPEIIINLTPPQLHVELNRKIISAGKHLFSEKPFAQTLDQAKELLALAEEKGVRVGCAPDTFLASGLQSVRWYLDSGLIGKPFFVTANMTTFGAETWHPSPEPFYRAGSGPLYEMAPYYLSSIVTILGPIERIAAISNSGSRVRHIYAGEHAGSQIVSEVPTHYSAIMQLRSGVTVNFNISYDIYRSNLPMFEIYGEYGTLTYPDPNFGGGAPTVYCKEQFTDPVYRHTPEAEARKEVFCELPELFPRVKDYSRGIGVLDLARAIEANRDNRAGGPLILHITEAIEALQASAESGTFHRMRTTCERPAPLTPGQAPGEI